LTIRRILKGNAVRPQGTNRARTCIGNLKKSDHWAREKTLGKKTTLRLPRGRPLRGVVERGAKERREIASPKNVALTPPRSCSR